MHGQDACAVNTSGNTQDGIATERPSPVSCPQIYGDSRFPFFPAFLQYQSQPTAASSALCLVG